MRAPSGAVWKLWVSRGCRRVRVPPTYLPKLTIHGSFRAPVPWTCVNAASGPCSHSSWCPRCPLVTPVTAKSETALKTRPTVSTQDPFSRLLPEVSFAQRIQACVTVISACVYSLPLTVISSRQGILSDLPLHFQQ